MTFLDTKDISPLQLDIESNIFANIAKLRPRKLTITIEESQNRALNFRELRNAGIQRLKLKKESEESEYQFEFQLIADGENETLVIEKLIIENLRSKEEFVEIIKRIRATKVLKL